jgi:putative transposase
VAEEDEQKMARRGYSQERIVYVLKQAEAGIKIGEICREHGISEQTFHNWKRKYGGMGVSELRLLEEENRKLKQLVADLTLDKHILQEVVKKRSKGQSRPRTGPPD